MQAELLVISGEEIPQVNTPAFVSQIVFTWHRVIVYQLNLRGTPLHTKHLHATVYGLQCAVNGQSLAPCRRAITSLAMRMSRTEDLNHLNNY